MGCFPYFTQLIITTQVIPQGPFLKSQFEESLKTLEQLFCPFQTETFTPAALDSGYVAYKR